MAVNDMRHSNNRRLIVLRYTEGLEVYRIDTERQTIAMVICRDKRAVHVAGMCPKGYFSILLSGGRISISLLNVMISLTNIEEGVEGRLSKNEGSSCP